jgi:hypothetical protein
VGTSGKLQVDVRGERVAVAPVISAVPWFALGALFGPVTPEPLGAVIANADMKFDRILQIIPTDAGNDALKNWNGKGTPYDRSGLKDAPRARTLCNFSGRNGEPRTRMVAAASSAGNRHPDVFGRVSRRTPDHSSSTLIGRWTQFHMVANCVRSAGGVHMSWNGARHRHRTTQAPASSSLAGMGTLATRFWSSS